MSLPLPPVMLSLPAAPVSESAPVPPVMTKLSPTVVWFTRFMSTPRVDAEALIASTDTICASEAELRTEDVALNVIVSVPTPPSTVSAPRDMAIVSLPEPPVIESLPEPPVMVSLPVPPVIEKPSVWVARVIVTATPVVVTASTPVICVSDAAFKVADVALRTIVSVPLPPLTVSVATKP